MQETAGLLTTYGNVGLRGNVPKADNSYVAKLKQAGAIVTAKTNVPDMGAGANSRNPVWGATGNPFNPALNAGGSSGGSAAALAAWAGKNGLPEQKFTETFNSFGVATKARRATQLQEAFKVQGVPSLGIAGRFYTDGSLTQTMDRALQVAEFLIGEVRRGR